MNRIRKITKSTGIISTIAGTGVSGSSGDDGAATSATLNDPYGVAVEQSSGDVYIADTGNHVIRKISSGTITKYAGTIGQSCNTDCIDDMNAVYSLLKNPRAVRFDSYGNLIIADGSNRIRKVNKETTVISTIAGTGNSPYYSPGGYNGDGKLAIEVGLGNALSIFINGTTIYVVLDNTVIRKFTPTQIIERYMGSSINSAGVGLGLIHFSSQQYDMFRVKANGQFFIAGTMSNAAFKTWPAYGNVVQHIAGNYAIQGSYTVENPIWSQLTGISDIEADPNTGEVYMMDRSNHCIRKINAEGKLVVFVGKCGQPGTLLMPQTMALMSNGDLLISDFSKTIRRVNKNTGEMTVFAGDPTTEDSCNDAQQCGEGGLATAARVNSYVWWIVVTPNDEVYFADDFHVIRKIGLDGKITTVVGNYYACYDDVAPCSEGELATNVQLGIVKQFAISPINGDIYFFEGKGYRLRVVSNSTGIVTTVAGNGSPLTSADFADFQKMSTTSKFGDIISLQFRPGTGELYFHDTQLRMIKMIDTTKSNPVSVQVTGLTGDYTGENMVPSQTNVKNPSAIAINSNGDFFFADTVTNHHRIRKLSHSTNTIAGVVGEGHTMGVVNGAAFEAVVNIYSPAQYKYFSHMYAFDDGSLVWTEAFFNVIRKYDASTGQVSIIAGKVNTVTECYPTSNACGDGFAATNAFLNKPTGLTVYNNEIYFADTNNQRVRKIDSSGKISTVAGSGDSGYLGDGSGAKAARLSSPTCVAFDPSNGDYYIGDAGNFKIRKVTPKFKEIQTIAGAGTSACNPDSLSCIPYDGCSATLVRFSNIVSLSLLGRKLFIADDKMVYYIDLDTNNIYRMTALFTGKNIVSGMSDGVNMTYIKFDYPSQILATNESVYVSDYNNMRIRKFESICPSGYTGTNCDIMTCYGKLVKDACSGPSQGTCTGPDTCTCTNLYNGNECQNEIKCGGLPFSDPNVCSAHGECVSSSVCTCDEGYQGSLCQIPSCFGYLSNDFDNVCSGKGNCNSYDVCNCQEGYYGEKCEMTTCFGIEMGNSTACNSHGACIGYNYCTCDANYLGFKCDVTFCDGISSQSIDACSEHGKYVDYNQCSCDANYFGSTCAVTICNSKFSNDSSVCSGNGQCIRPNLCSCNPSYMGSDCNQYYCNGISHSDEKVCSGSGKCTAPNTCSCDTDYSGTYCSEFTCNSISHSDSKVCSGNGQCTKPDTCTCNPGFKGTNCETVDEILCFGVNSKDEKVCSGHGSCEQNDKCNCTEGYFGDSCTEYTCESVLYSSEAVCSGKGVCTSPNTCSCEAGYFGKTCSSQTTSSPQTSTKPQTSTNPQTSTKPQTSDHTTITTCFGIAKTNNLVCSGHGSCIEMNKCACSNGWIGDQCQQLTSINVTISNITTNSMMVQWTAHPVSGVSFNLGANSISKLVTGTQQLLTDLTPQTTYTVTVKAIKGTFFSNTTVKIVSTLVDTKVASKQGSSIPITVPMKTSKPVTSGSRIAVKLPAAFSVSQKKRGSKTFMLTDGVNEYSLKDFAYDNNELSAVLNDNLPVGNYYIVFYVSASETVPEVTSGKIEVTDSQGNVQEFSFDLPVIEKVQVDETVGNVVKDKTNDDLLALLVLLLIPIGIAVAIIVAFVVIYVVMRKKKQGQDQKAVELQVTV